MNYQEFASDLPQHRTTTFTSVEAMRRQGVDECHRQLGSGKILIDLAVLETDRHSVCPENGHSLGVPAARDGVRVRYDMLAAAP